MRPRVNIDVDLTMVDTLSPWLDWFKENSRDNIEFNFDWHNGSYNLSQTMQKYMDQDPNNYWRQRDLYDHMMPMEYSQEAIWMMSDEFDVKFVTHSLHEHIDSKVDFLQREFGVEFPIIHCHANDKWEHAAEIWIEDKVETLDTLTQVHPDAMVFHMINEMNKDFVVQGAIRVANWKEISRRVF